MGVQRLKMEHRYDAIVVLSHHLEKDGTLDFSTTKRMDAAIAMHNEGLSDLLIVSGGIVREHDRHTHAYGMRIYAINNSVSEGSMILEYLSRDTAGQIPIIEGGILRPSGIERIIVVSGKSHMPRVKRICEFVAPERKIEYVGVEDGYNGSEAEHNERNSLEMFERTFNGIEPGNIDSIIERLFAQHRLYTKGAEDMMAQFERMKAIYEKKAIRRVVLNR